MHMIYLENIIKKYNSNLVLNNTSIEFDSDINFIIGENGVGKSTLINIISGAVTLNSGNIFIGEDLINIKKGVYKKQIGFLLDFPTYPYHFKLSEYINLLNFIYSIDVNLNDNYLNDLLNFFELKKYLNVKIIDMSKGYIKRVKLLASMIHNPSIYVYDEPFSALDKDFVDLLLNKINELSFNGKYFLISSHNNQIFSFNFKRRVSFFKIENKKIYKHSKNYE